MRPHPRSDQFGVARIWQKAFFGPEVASITASTPRRPAPTALNAASHVPADITVSLSNDVHQCLIVPRPIFVADCSAFNKSRMDVTGI